MKLYKTIVYVILSAMILLTKPVHAGLDDKGADQSLSKKTSARIVGGHEAEPGAWPWMAALVERSYDSLYSGHFCGGALIHPGWVVTAAHCMEGETAGNVDVVLGIHDLKKDTGERIRVKRIIMHPSYDDVMMYSDIALLELEENASQETIGLVAKDSILDGKDAVVLGWGSTDGSLWSSSPDTLQQVSVPIVPNETCKAAYSDEEITDSMVCAGYNEGGKDACQGDSGGPLVVCEGDTWDTCQLAGIVSWGEGCAEPGYYGVYTRVSQFADYIEEYVSMLKLGIPEKVTEGDGLLREQGSVSVQEAPDRDILVGLDSWDISEVVVPATVSILAGQISAVFDITIEDDEFLDGPQMIAITAHASDQGSVTGMIQINDNETAVLSIRIPESATEGDDLLRDQGTVTVSRNVDKDVQVSLNSDDMGEVTVPTTVMISAGQTEATFDITIIYDGEDDETQTATITASVPGWTSGSDTIEVIHNEIDFFTETFKQDNDLDHTSLTFTPDSSINFYRVCRQEADAFPYKPAGGITLDLKDDDYERINLSEGAHVSLYGVRYSSFYVGSDGDISFGSGNNEKDRTLSFHFKEARISGLLNDFDPERTTGITWKQSDDRAIVTYLDIPEFGNRLTSNSFQVEMFFDGIIRMTYLDISAKDGIAGLSRGGGVPENFAGSDFREYALCKYSLQNAISALKTLTGMPDNYLNADAYNDGRIGLEDVIFLLRTTARQ